MKRIALTVAALAFASMAWAHNCPNEVKAIDAALPKAKLDAKQTAEVTRGSSSTRPASTPNRWLPSAKPRASSGSSNFCFSAGFWPTD
jgi:hypothetical protein